MKSLKVIEKNNYDYVLLDSDNKRYYKNMDFYNTSVNVNDYLYMPECILEEENIFTFGPLQNSNISANDIIKVINSDGQLFLQRYYG